MALTSRAPGSRMSAMRRSDNAGAAGHTEVDVDMSSVSDSSEKRCGWTVPRVVLNRSYFAVFGLVFLALAMTSSSEAGPVSRRASEVFDSTHYLQEFGYLPQSDRETGALRTQEEVQRAVRELQRMAQIPMTGNFDEKTISLMHQPRCGVPDVESRASRGRGKRYAIGPSKWEHKDLSFRILNYSPDLRAADQRDALIRAFRVWMDVTQLRFYEEQQGDADILIKFGHGYHGDSYPFDGQGMVLAHAFFPGEERGGDVHFDEDEQWTVHTEEGVNLFGVAAHEIGHSLGLKHSNVPGALMYPWYQGYTEDFHLHTDDIAGIQYLYGYKEVPYDPYSPGGDPPYHHPGSKSPSTQTPVSLPPIVTPPITPVPATPPRSTQRPTSAGPHDDDGPPPQAPQTPDPCTTSLDAIAVLRTEIFAFKDKWFWRIDGNGITKGYPVELSRFWYDLPLDLSHVDAIYERESDHKFVLFSGKRFWLMNGNQVVVDFPKQGRPLTAMGFPADIEKIDAAFVWGHNHRTYFISGKMYWRFNELDQRMEYDYPRDMSMWRGVPLPVDTAFQSWDGRTYFFHGSQYWEFNDALMKVRTKNYPREIGSMWLECRSAPSTVTAGRSSSEDDTGSSSCLTGSILTMLASLSMIYTCRRMWL